MRTRKCSVFLVLCILFLSCLVEQCHLLAFTGLGNAIGNSMTLTHALGMTMTQSILQNFLSTFALGFSTLHTMALSLISGFIMGNIALIGFLFFLLAVVPAEERRSLGGNSVFTPYLLTHHKTEHTLHGRYRRSIVNATLPVTVTVSHENNFTVKSVDFKEDSRIPRFLTRLVQKDPLNCMPLVMCGLSAAKKPNGRTDILNDYAYLMKEFISTNADGEDRSDEDSQEDGFGRARRRKPPMRWRDQLEDGEGEGQQGKRKKDVDEIIDEIQRDEEDNIEDLVLTEMANDPNDLPFALKDMKIRGLKKTMSKMPAKSRQSYLEKLLGESDEDDGPPQHPPHLMSNEMMMENYQHPHLRHEYPDSSSFEDEQFYYSRELTRGGFPPPPPTPPMPDYENSEELYKRNLRILDQNLAAVDFRRKMPPRRSRRDLGVQMERKKREVEQATNIFEKTRLGAEAGVAYRSPRQCRSLFQECPVNTIAKPAVDGNPETPFLNRAVNNLRRVLLGTQAGGSKQKRVNEIKEVVEKMHPPVQQAGSEVKVVLNIGPSAPDPHRAGAYPPPISVSQTALQTPSTTPNKAQAVKTKVKPATYNDLLAGPTTATMPDSPTSNKKTLVYHNPSSTKTTPTVSAPPSLDLDSLEQILRTTLPPDSEEDSTTLQPPNLYAGEEESSLEDLLPTKYPMTKEEYAQSLRETLGIFDRFKEAHTKPKQTVKTTAKTIVTTPKPTQISSKVENGKTVQGKVSKKPTTTLSKAASDDQPQDDVNPERKQVQQDIRYFVNWFKKLRKKIRGEDDYDDDDDDDNNHFEGSSEESFEHGPGHHSKKRHKHKHPTLVAVPLPHVRHQIQWRSGSTMIKNGLYNLLFASRGTKPLLPPHPPRHSARDDDDGSWSGEHPENPAPPHFGPPNEHRGPPFPNHQPPNRLRTDSAEAGETTGPKKMKPPQPVLLPVGMKKPPPPDKDDSSESSSYSDDDDDDLDDAEPTEPQLVYSPFKMFSGKPRNHPPMKRPKKKYKTNKKKKGNSKSTVLGPTSSTTTTTAKPTRRILKYKG